MDSIHEHLEFIPAGALFVEGTLSIPVDARGIVLFPYGIERPSRASYTTRLAELLQQSALATLLVDLFTSEERAQDAVTGFFRENVDIMQQRIIGIGNWLSEDERTQNLRICYFGSDITGAAVLIAAVARPDLVVAIACAEGRMELAHNYLSQVDTPVLLLSAEKDTQGIEANRQAFEQLQGPKSLEVVKGAAGIFEDSNTQEHVAHVVGQWFKRHLGLG
jgi:putative phosphoribosyl transferase